VARDLIDELPELAGNLVHDAHTAILLREATKTRTRRCRGAQTSNRETGFSLRDQCDACFASWHQLI
jgi:hypothetical protein